MHNSKRDAEAIVHTIVNKGPFLRFAWGLTPEAGLNQHPRPSLTSTNASSKKGRFDPQNPSLFLRVERQILWPFPEQQAALFTIRTYLTDCQQIRNDKEKKEQLVSALKSMTKEQLKYKCLNKNRKPIIQWLSKNSQQTDKDNLLRKAIHRIYRVR